MDKQELGRRLRALRAASGRTVAAVATEAGLSVPYVANLENGRGNPTMDAVNRIAGALGTRARVEFMDDNTVEAEPVTVPLSSAVVRVGRTSRFRRDCLLISETLAEDPVTTAARLLELLARIARITNHDLKEADYFRLLDAVVLVALHPAPAEDA
ncbi:helix-turn-helix domain-containing protein [Phytohabitans aurantiacus]|uniref:HTH cro/C1-type domain-containing protein n=1 Tax=Phytohabitans aurantiacus TaxID=3016789 RepID=A0ABQ5R8I7_9ACTN|nr:helix-turn-helix transcriptional regulator [Phytohabitans aurantiacus]GLI02903.1 hypothetical protein Pa4123_81810 [Phytohabitans aurantiacus]